MADEEWKQERHKGHFAHNRYKLNRVPECHVSECQMANKNTTELQKAQTLCATEQQKPSTKPLARGEHNA